MPTYYEIETRNVLDTDEIQRLGRLGFAVVATAVTPSPAAKTGQYLCLVVMQRERAVPEYGPIHDEYYNGDPSGE